MAAAATSITSTEIVPNLGGKLVRVNFTKADAKDTIAVPSVYGTTVVWCDVVKTSTQVKDPATAVSGLTVTLSVGTGAMTGLFLVE